MIIEYPLLWVTLLFILGILCGGFFSFFPLCFFILLLAVLLGITLLRKHRHLQDVLTLFFWFLLGCARMSMYESAPQETRQERIFTVLQEKAEQQNKKLVNRLQEAGLKDDALQLNAALILGQDKLIPREMRNAYAHVGASHLLALSGMNLGMLYGIIYLLLLRHLRFSEWRWFMLPFVLLAMWGYVFLTGMSISLIRAAEMSSIITISTFSQNRMSSFHSLAFSALLILLTNPSVIGDVSFLLSFFAVFFIFALFLPLKNILRKTNWAVNLLLLSLVAQLGTAPLSLYLFHTLPLIGVPASIILIPLTTAITYLGIILLLIPFPPLATLLTALVQLQNSFVLFCDGISCLTLSHLHPEAWEIILTYTIILCGAFRLQTLFGRGPFQSVEKSANN